MKAKRILALAVTIAMAIGMMPAFEITAGAADTTITAMYDIASKGESSVRETKFNNSWDGSEKREAYAAFALTDALKSEREFPATLTVTVKTPQTNITDGVSDVLYYMTDTVPGYNTLISTNLFRNNKDYTTTEGKLEIPSTIKAEDKLTTTTFTVEPNNKKYLIVCITKPEATGNSGAEYYRYNNNVSDAYKEYLTVPDASEKKDITVNYVDEIGNNIGSLQTKAYVGSTLNLKNDAIAPTQTITKDGLYTRNEIQDSAVIGADTTTVTVKYAKKAMANVTVNYNFKDAEGNIVSTYTEGPKEYTEGDTVYNYPASDGFYFEYGDKASIVKNSTEQSYTVGADDGNEITKEVNFEVAAKYAVLKDTFVANDEKNHNNDSTYDIFLAAKGNEEGVGRAPAKDADGAATYTSTGGDFGNTRAGIMEFAIDEGLQNGAVYLKLYVNKHKTNGTQGDAKIAAYTIADQESLENITINYNNNALASLSDPIFAVDTIYGAGGGTGGSFTDVNDWVRIDVTEAVRKALADEKTKITFKLLTPIGGVDIANRESAVIGGVTAGKAAHLEAVEGKTVKVDCATKLTKMGTEVSLTGESAAVTVPTDSSIKVTAPDGIAVYMDQKTNTLYPTSMTDRTLEITSVSGDMNLTGLAAGISVQPGAQVRIGQGVQGSEGNYTIAKPVAGSSELISTSGIRFIGIIDDTGVACYHNENDIKVGIKITAAGSDTVVDIPADKFQDGDKKVFTAALVNLSRNNYNRVFTATPYVTITKDGIDYTYDGANTVSRSIYEVASGILAESTFEVSDKGNEAPPEAIYNVLNAYVNEVGIRLARDAATGEITDSTTQGAKGAYALAKELEEGQSPKIALTAKCTPSEDGNSYSVEITANGRAEIFDYWKDYIRLNNGSLKDYIPGDYVLSPDRKTLTFTINRTKNQTTNQTTSTPQTESN